LGKKTEAGLVQGCQMVDFQTKKSQFCKIWVALDWKKLKYFISILNIILTFGIFYDYLVLLMFIWYIFPVLVSWTKKNLATLVSSPEVTKLGSPD
jgi:hypothetical protein